MCRGASLTSGALVRCSQPLWGFPSLKSCLDPTGGGVTLQGPGPQACEEGEDVRRRRGQLRWVAGRQPQPKASPQPQQGNLISCFRGSLGPVHLSLTSWVWEELIPRFQVMCLISLSSIGVCRGLKIADKHGQFFPPAGRFGFGLFVLVGGFNLYLSCGLNCPSYEGFLLLQMMLLYCCFHCS